MNNSTQNNSLSIAKVIYILLIVGTIIGITGIIAMIMAYVNKDDSTDWLQSHYRFQIRTFWIGTLYVVIGAITSSIVLLAILSCYSHFSG